MKAVVACLVLVAVCIVMTGCATPYPMGAAYTEIKLPVTATANSGRSPKIGEAMCTTVLGLVATGDASIEAAKRDGGITKVHHVDWSAKNILGLYGEYKVVVYGE